MISQRIPSVALSCLLFAVCFRAEAQEQGKIFRIGYLDPSSASASAVLVDAFRDELRKLGWIEGKNITIERRFLKQDLAHAREVAAD